MQSTNTIVEFFSSSTTQFYIAIAGAAWVAREAFDWVKGIRDEDLKGIKTDLSSQTTVISSGFNKLSDNIHEMRTDLRTFYTSPDPIMTPVSARSVRKRKSVAERSAAKAKPAAKKAPAKKKAKS